MLIRGKRGDRDIPGKDCCINMILLRFLTSSKAIKITRNKEPPDLYSSSMSTLYSEPRKPDIDYFFDNSKGKPGNQNFKII